MVPIRDRGLSAFNRPELTRAFETLSRAPFAFGPFTGLIAPGKRLDTPMFIIRIHSPARERTVKPRYVGKNDAPPTLRVTTKRALARQWACDVEASFALAYWRAQGMIATVARSL